jgi:hypothetical protein
MKSLCIVRTINDLATRLSSHLNKSKLTFCISSLLKEQRTKWGESVLLLPVPIIFDLLHTLSFTW